jgi:hypothetical protein
VTTYLATTYVPGYLPMDDDPPTFDDPREAWEYLAQLRKEGEDHVLEDEGGDGYSATVNVLEALAAGDWENYGTDAVGTGTVIGETPGGRMHDLGLAYSVTVIDDEDPRA